MYNLPNEPILIAIALVFIFLTLFVVSIIFVNTYSFFGKWLKFLEKESNKDESLIEKEAMLKAEKIIQDAKKSALLIIEESTKKAQEIINTTQVTTDQSKIEVSNAVNEMISKNKDNLVILNNDIESHYQTIAESQKVQDQEIINKVGENLERIVEKEINSFEDSIQKTTVDLQKNTELKINEKYKEIEKDLEDYKNNKVLEIEAKLYSFIVNVSKDVLGHTLTLEGHQTAIKTFIERAKKGL